MLRSMLLRNLAAEAATTKTPPCRSRFSRLVARSGTKTIKRRRI